MITAPQMRAARALLGKVDERTRLSGDHTVVALAGATGSGKSSLFNALAGLDSYSTEVSLRLLAREAALYNNRPEEAIARLAQIKAQLERRPPEYQDGEELVALGQALLLLGVEPRLVLENCFQRAERMDPAPREAFLAAGELGAPLVEQAGAELVDRNGDDQFGRGQGSRSGERRGRGGYGRCEGQRRSGALGGPEHSVIPYMVAAIPSHRGLTVA